MPIDPNDIDALPEYTTAQRLKMYRKAEMDILAAGQSYGVEGRQKMAADLATVQAMIAKLEQQVAEEAQGAIDAGGIAHARFGQPQ